MIFYAHLRKGSGIDRLWKKGGRLGGTINGIPFRRKGAIYSSIEPLPPAAVLPLHSNPDIFLEVCGQVTESPQSTESTEGTESTNNTTETVQLPPPPDDPTPPIKLTQKKTAKSQKL